MDLWPCKRGWKVEDKIKQREEEKILWDSCSSDGWLGLAWSCETDEKQKDTSKLHENGEKEEMLKAKFGIKEHSDNRPKLRVSSWKQHPKTS